MPTDLSFNPERLRPEHPLSPVSQTANLVLRLFQQFDVLSATQIKQLLNHHIPTINEALGQLLERNQLYQRGPEFRATRPTRK